jgi:23S rRNA-/tRNA-specific pseudouridylate synthase
MIRKASSKRTNPYLESEYSCSDGIRSVVPYVHEFTTFAKGRWLGREIIEVLTREFGGHPREYWDNAILRGHVRINNKIVLDTYRFKNSDAMLHRTHRHEPSIVGEVIFVGDTETLMAVSKPPSIPVHPCGAYRFNSLMYILAKEPVIEDQPELYLVHRLDRVTSGLVVLAKSKDAAASLSKEIRDKSTKKTYLARVKGFFPLNVEKFKRLELSEILNVVVDDDGDDDDKEGKSENNNKSYKKVELSVEKKKEQLQIKQQQQGQKRHRNGNIIVEINESDLPPRVRDTPSFEEVVGSDRVGYHVDSESGNFTLRCPIGVISHRDGVHACDPLEGKEAMTGFRMLGYDNISDTSLVECSPITGRTHQLRLHLQIIGNPIANDPCYGGELFYGDSDRRQRAIDVLRQVKIRVKIRVKVRVKPSSNPNSNSNFNPNSIPNLDEERG